MAQYLLERPTWAPFVVILLTLGSLSCGDPSPLSPDPAQRLTGSYTFTVTMSPSCRDREGPWKFRADITQSGRDFTVKMYEGEFDLGLYAMGIDEFKGQDNPDGVLFFSKHGTLFWEAKAGIWSDGQARGPFQDGRIEALFNGKGNGCRAPDHSWTFVRR